MRRTGAQILVELLERQGVHTVTGIPGGSILPIYDALGQSKIRHILARHEQGAAFVAQGMARSSGHVAVCMASSGPGALNLLTALADAQRDSVPLIAITGQVPRSLIGTDAFQEADICTMAKAICKEVWQIDSAKALLQCIPHAFAIANGPRPGAVLIDIPKDVQTEICNVGQWPAPGQKPPAGLPSPRDIQDAALLINQAQRPLFYIGGGCIASNNANRALLTLAENCQIPIVTSFMGLGAIDTHHPLSLGMIGMHGNPLANHALASCDVLIAIGVRFDDRATGKLNTFCSRSSIIHIDIDPLEHRRIVPSILNIIADAQLAMQALAKVIIPGNYQAWKSELQQHAATFQSIDADAPRWIYEAIKPENIVCTDVGQHQMWASQFLHIKYPRHFISSGGMGTMGFGLPAAIGAAIAMPQKQIVCISGDGSIMMNIQELALLVELDLNVKLIIVNNAHLGLVRQQQDLLYAANFNACRYDRPSDMVSIARAFGLSALRTENRNDLLAALNHSGPCLIDIPINAAALVFPMVPPGCANTTMVGLRIRSGISEPSSKADECKPMAIELGV